MHGELLSDEVTPEEAERIATQLVASGRTHLCGQEVISARAL